jgi:hypothetical protein
MPDNKRDQLAQQAGSDAAKHSAQINREAWQVKATIVMEEIEEWDVVSSDQRRPQFRSEENYGRRNSQGNR